MNRVWDFLGLLFGRAFMGAISGFAVMLVVRWTAMYFHVDPPEPKAEALRPLL